MKKFLKYIGSKIVEIIVALIIGVALAYLLWKLAEKYTNISW